METNVDQGIGDQGIGDRSPDLCTPVVLDGNSDSGMASESFGRNSTGRKSSPPDKIEVIETLA